MVVARGLVIFGGKVIICLSVSPKEDEVGDDFVFDRFMIDRREALVAIDLDTSLAQSSV